MAKHITHSRTDFLADALRFKFLTKSEFLVLDQILRHNIDIYKFSRKGLSRTTGLAVATVRKALKSIIEAGLIAIRMTTRKYNGQEIPCFFVDIKDKRLVFGGYHTAPACSTDSEKKPTLQKESPPAKGSSEVVFSESSHGPMKVVGLNNSRVVADMNVDTPNGRFQPGVDRADQVSQHFEVEGSIATGADLFESELTDELLECLGGRLVGDICKHNDDSSNHLSLILDNLNAPTAGAVTVDSG